MISFGLPALLALLVALPLLAAVFAWGARQRRVAARRFAGAGLALVRSGDVDAGQGLHLALLLIGAGLLVFAVARPQHGQQKLVLPRQGSDVVLAIDVSRSMAVQDVSPSRLHQAKQAVTAVINHLQGDRVGLVVFAGSAVLRFPLTTDQQAAQQVINSLAVLDGGVKGGTDIASAITTAESTLGGTQTQGKVIVLISDGEDLAGNDLKAAERAASQGIILDTVGVGTSAGGPVSYTNGINGRTTPVIDPSTGRQAISRRDDANLQQLASAGHGTAYDGNSTAFAFGLSNSVDRLQPTTFSGGLATIPHEYFQVPLALALLILTADLLLLGRGAIRRRTRSAETNREPAEAPSERTQVAS